MHTGTAAGAEPPPTLTGEAFRAQNALEGGSSGECDQTSESTFSFQFTGTATGPYPGTYTESGTVVLGPQELRDTGLFPDPEIPGSYLPGSRNFTTGRLLTVETEFQIDSPVGQVTGTKTLAFSDTSDRGVCAVVEDGPVLIVPGRSGDISIRHAHANLEYEAIIDTGNGTYRDAGTALLVLDNLTAQYDNGGSSRADNFFEFFTSTMTQPEYNGPPPPDHIALTPMAATNPVGTSHTVTANVSGAGQPTAGSSVLFRVSGSVSTSGSCTTNTGGQCDFTYQGPDMPGADSITACADVNDNGLCDPGEPVAEATKAWLLPTSTTGQTTGGGQLDDPDHQGSIAFGYNAKSSGDSIKGECNLVDIAPDRNIKFKCLTVDALVQTSTHATFFGDATINGTATRYRVDVDDIAEPGGGRDTFKLTTSSGYTAAGILAKGNIQVHG